MENIKATEVGFEPIEAAQEAAGFEASLEPVEFHAVGLKREVEMDGNLGDEAWERAPLVPGLTWRTEVVGPQTDIRVLYSPTALYIGAVMYEPDMENLVAQFDQHDLAIYNDDCLELLIDPTGRPDMFYHIAVNALCSIYDAKGGRKNWNGEGFFAKSSRHEDKWIVELKLPFAAFDNAAMPEPGEFWGIRFARERHHDRQPAVAVPPLMGRSLDAREYLGKLIFDPASSDGIKLSCKETEFLMGLNSIPVEVYAPEPTSLKLRARICNSDNDIINEVTQSFTAPATVDFKLPIETDTALRVVISVLTESGESVDSTVLSRAFAYVTPGFNALYSELSLIEGGCANILSINHPVHRGVASSIRRMMNAISDYMAEVKKAIDCGKTVEKDVSDSFAALQNGFKEFRNKYNYLVWQTSPWETGSPYALPPEDYSTSLSLSFKQASNERERVTLVLSGLLLNHRIDLRLVPYAIDEGDTYIARDRFEFYMEPFTDHNGVLNTDPLIRVPGDIITVTPGSAVRVHIVFNSRGVDSGKYQTKIKIKPLYDYSVANREIPVNMEVWNFTLPETRDWPMDCFFWGDHIFDNDESAMLRLMHSRHINWGWTEGVRYTAGFKGLRRLNSLPEGQLFNPDLVKYANEDFFRTAKELGMRFIFGWDTCKSMEWHHLMDQRLLNMGFNRDDFIFKAHIADEFKKANIKGDVKDVEFRERLLKENPGWTFQAVYLSSPPPSGATLEDIDEAGLTDTHKNWTLISGLLKQSPEKTKETVDYFKNKGCTVWAYECETTMHTKPVLDYFRFFPWFGYRQKLEGVAIWTSIFSPKGDDGLDNREGYSDGATMLDSNLGPIPTKRFEAVSKGLEDVAYMFELENQLKRLDDKLSDAEKNEYRYLIGDRLDEIIKASSQQLVDEWRDQIGTAIDKLSRM